jgi:hypothetical protein
MREQDPRLRAIPRYEVAEHREQLNAAAQIALGFVGASMMRASGRRCGEGERTDRILGEPPLVDHAARPVGQFGCRVPVLLLDRDHRGLREA